MRVLLINPLAKFNYKAPYVPLGLLSIATILKKNGHEIRFINRCFDKTNISKVLDEFLPDICGVSFVSSRCITDGIKVSREMKSRSIPVVWGGTVPSANYEAALRSGLCDYVSFGEGEFTWLDLTEAVPKGDVSAVEGIAYIDKEGNLCKNPDRPLAELADIPNIDWTIEDPGRYMHHYINCKKMMYLCSSKGCPCNCTFCCNPAFHQYKYRKKPTEAVLNEIEFLINNYGMDGVYFSDECWRTKKADVHEFCEKLAARHLPFVWGGEARIGMLGREELQLMYDTGCRWLFFGVESGSDEMLCCVKKGITTAQIRETIKNCKEIGITAIASFIIGYPDETNEQLTATIRLIQELDSQVNAVNIFTPVIQSEIYDKLVEEKRYTPKTDFSSLEEILVGESSNYNCYTVPVTDLKVIRAHFLWKSFTKKNSSKSGKPFEVAINSVIDAVNNLTRLGFLGIFPGMVYIAKEFFSVFWYANFYPGIKRKYKL